MKTIVIGLLSLCMTAGIFAQDDAEASFEYPVKGDSEIGILLGLFSSYVSEDGFSTSDNTSYIYNIGFGVHYDYYFSKTWSLKTRLNYDPRGLKETITNIKLKATYLSIPVMANWHFGKRKRWYLHFGPYAAILLSADQDGQDVKDMLDSTEIGLDVGIGVKIPVGNMMFFIENDGQNDFTAPTEVTERKFVRNSLTVGIIF